VTSYLAIRISHSLPAILLLLGIIAHLIIVWRAKSKDAQQLAAKLQRTRNISLPVFALLLLSLPVSGWWLTSLAGFPLGQTWLLASILLLPVLFVVLWLIYRSLGQWLQATVSEPAQDPGKAPLLALIWTLLLLLVLLAISALMGAKPV